MISCELWSINRWLQFTGWRLAVSLGHPTRIGFKFFGWRNLGGWK